MTKLIALALATLISVSACTESEEVSLEAVTQQAKTTPQKQSMVGFWRTKAFAQGAWVDLIWVVGKHHAWHVVTAYADEELTIPLVRWDIVRRYELKPPTNSTFEMEWDDSHARLYAYVDNPGLFAGIGIDDCSLDVGVSRDLSSDNCGAPLFPIRDCTLLDYVRIEGDQMTFGDPSEGDRCVQRPTTDEAWTFTRVPFSAELVGALFNTPWTF